MNVTGTDFSCSVNARVGNTLFAHYLATYDGFSAPTFDEVAKKLPPYSKLFMPSGIVKYVKLCSHNTQIWWAASTSLPWFTSEPPQVAV
jgi:hypothetical protein